MGSFPTKAIKGEDQPTYYDLQEMAREWAYDVDSMGGNTSQERGRTKRDDYYLKFNYDKLQITDGEPVFERVVESFSPEPENIEYTTVVDNREYINNTGISQSSTFNAEGHLETNFSAELTRALKVEGRSSVSFTFVNKSAPEHQSKSGPEHQSLGKKMQRQVNIEEMRDGKLKFETKDKLKWSASYPVNVRSKTKLTAQLLVKAKEESQVFTQPIKLEGRIIVHVWKKDPNTCVRTLQGAIGAVVEHFIKKRKNVAEYFQVKNDQKDGFVEFETKGKLKYSLGVEEIMVVEESELKY